MALFRELFQNLRFLCHNALIFLGQGVQTIVLGQILSTTWFLFVFRATNCEWFLYIYSFPFLLSHFKKNYFFISWRLITLQYCSGFCHTLTRISHGFTCIPHPDPPSHLRLHQVQALVSCIQPGLVICFTLDNIHVLMLFSWNIPPSPSPTESKSLFYTF